jgi:ActR/RegA family two-component response regulator
VWKDLAIAAAIVVVGVVATKPGFLGPLIQGSPAPTVKGEVIVVSAKDLDLLSVSQTASVRGYRVSIAANTEDGVAQLQNAGKQIAVVVIDGDMAGANRVVVTANRIHPEARLVILTGTRQAGDVSARLLGAGVR